MERNVSIQCFEVADNDLTRQAVGLIYPVIYRGDKPERAVDIVGSACESLYGMVEQDSGLLLAVGGLARETKFDGPEVEYLVTAPAEQGKGYGSTILSHLEKVARKAGARALYLASTPGAITFYTEKQKYEFYEENPRRTRWYRKEL